MRGGILDIYSIGNDKPYRIELFGNEIESIRLIDPETQLSERKLTHVSVIPRMDQSMASGPGISLLKFLPTNTVVWVQDYSICVDRLEDTWESFTTFLNLKPGIPVKEEAEGDERWSKKEVQETDLVAPQLMKDAMLSATLISFGVCYQRTTFF